MSVAELLQQARAAHLDYRRAIDAGQVVNAKEALDRAYALRLQAEALDPNDPAWHEDDKFKQKHYPLLRFYDRLASADGR